MVFDSKGSHTEGCHICGGFPGNMSKPVNVLYQCSTCNFFTCDKHTSIKTLQKVCPNCRSPKLKSAMSKADVKKMKKGGMPGSKTIASEQIKAQKKGKGFTPIAGAGGGGAAGGVGKKGLFGGGGIFGGGDSNPEVSKVDQNDENAQKIKIDPNGEGEITIKIGEDGEVEANTTTKGKDKKEFLFDDGDENLTVKINLGKNSKGDINVSFSADPSEKKQKVTGYYNAAEEGTPLKGNYSASSNTHAPIPTGLGDESDATKKGTNVNSEKQNDLENEIIVVIEQPGDESAGGGYEPSGSYHNNPNLENNENASGPVGTSNQVASTQGTIQISETNIDHILDSVLEDDDLAQQLLDQIDDDELKKLAEEYLADDSDEEGDEDEKSKKKSKKKSKLLREYTKSLRPAAAKNYNTDQIFKELDKSIDVYIEHPNDETKPNYVHPTLADAFFKPSLEGLSSMLNREKEFYNDKSKGAQKTVSLVQFDLAESGRSYYEKLLNEHSLVCSAVAFGPRNINKFDDDALKESLEDIPGVVAVGNIGLDMHFAPQTLEKQKKVFKYHIKIAEEYQLPIFITSEKADEQIVELLKEIESVKVPLIFASPIVHPDVCKICIDMNMYVVIRSEITLATYKDTYLKHIGEIPSERWLLASGSEFIIPTKNDDKVISSKNPLIPEAAPEKNHEGKTLVTGDSSFISKKDSTTQDISDNWNKPELIRDTLNFLVDHFNKKKHPFHRKLTENFIHVFNGEAAKEIRYNFKTAKEKIEADKEKNKDKPEEKKVLIIKAEE